MAKKRKLSLKMKRTLRISAAVLFLLSAITVAVIPQRDVEAGTDNPTVTLTDAECSIPKILPTDTIYTTGDGMFQFAYKEKNSGGDKVAVIVGYDYERSLSGGTLTIPETFDAYVKYTHAQGTTGGYVAVGGNGSPLYYPVYEKTEKLDSDGNPELDEDGNPVYENVLTGYSPCLYSTFDKWYYIYDDNGFVTSTLRDPSDYYYTEDNEVTFKRTTSEVYQRIKDATVAYISSQHVVKDENDNWVLDTAVQGIFSKATNIVKLVTGNNLLGIGNYAFYNCASLQGIQLGDGANYIGNYAFANCINLKTANFPLNSSILALGDHVFYNCRSLETFTVPVAVKKIGDSAFEGCTGLVTIDLKGSGQQVILEEMGDNVFKNCTALDYLEMPVTYNQDFNLAWLEGCINLRYIQIPNVNMKVVDDSAAGFTFEDFMNMVPEKFYFEGKDVSEIHKISKNNSFAFKYLDEEIYEKIYNATGDAGTGQSIFRVDNNNELIYFSMDDTVKQIVIPPAIGPYYITVIGSDSFQGNHNITKINIPASITEIKSNAFKGCHRLKDVIFAENSRLKVIEDNAFDTQIVDPILDPCTLDSVPVLTFTGEAIKGNVIFDYAMNPVNKINNGSQPLTYITFYTGWPSNMTIRYNPTTDKNELVDYTSGSDLITYNVNSFPYFKKEYVDACTSAYAALNGSGANISEDADDVLDAVQNLFIPSGVEAIKSGLISGTDGLGNPTGDVTNKDIITVTAMGLAQIEPYTFKGCTSLVGAYFKGDTVSLGDYAFQDCEKLFDVDILTPLKSFGKRPFAGCKRLEYVDFGSNQKYSCENAIIYENEPTVQYKVLEVLESRGVTFGTGNIPSGEMKNVHEIAPEAFMDCEGIMSVDFSTSALEEIPESCFENTSGLYSVKLNNGCRKISKNAFKNSDIRYLEIPNTVNVIDNSAFVGDPQTITFYCELTSAAADYASNYPNIVVSEKPVTFKVNFYDEDGTTLLETVYVNAGENAVPNVTPTKEGYTFKGWFPAPVAIRNDMNTYATYEAVTEQTFTVTFIDYDDTVLYIQNVKIGTDAITPASPSRAGYTFTGWRPGFTNVQNDIITYAQYEKDTGSEKNSESGSGSEKNSGNNSNKPGSNGTTGNMYNVIVKDGSGSGSYVAGATVIVAANTPANGKVFDKWVCDNEKVVLASTTIAATTFTMPESNVTITATYKDAPQNNGNNNGGSGSSNNNGNSTNSGSTVKPNTSVTITKPGFSNEGLASAIVAGSTDNYVLKITESATAKKEVDAALESLYGSTKDLKYLAMDISLYDSTGKNKIENTDNLKVTVTMPIPDDLVPYAGNNRVGYVLNGKLIELSPKFTTINGVTCISFVAPHFSPYTIYVDTTNLTASTIQDMTPKTGDGISPKWFLVAGLACASAFFFIKRDKKRVKVKA